MLRALIIVSLSGLFLSPTADAAISVGVNGSARMTFDSVPPATEWTTLSVGTGPAVITNVAQLDAGVQLLSAAGITNALPLTAVYPPAENALARWNSNRQLLQTRPTSNSFSVLMAALRNDSGHSQPLLTVIYELGAVTNSLSGVEPVPGLRAYFSRTGAAGSWQVIPELSIDTPGTAVATLNLPNWPAGGLLYLLWADDNATTETDGAYTIDNFIVRTVTVDGPALEIVNPVGGATFVEGVAIPITAYARFFGTMTNCTFLVDGTPVSSDNAPRFGTTANGSYAHPTAGLRGLTAVARNSSGASITSAVVQITVQPTASPKLAIALINGTLVQLSWPVASAGYTIEATIDPGGGAWAEVEEPDNQFGGAHHVYVDVLSSAMFFRLWKP